MMPKSLELLAVFACAAAVSLGGCEGPDGGQGADGGGTGWWDIGLADSLPDGTTAEPCKKDADCKNKWQCLAVPGQKGAKYCIPPGGCNPGPEVCNGADDDCDGQIDDAATCDDGNLCNGAEQCAAGACQPAASPLDCSDGDACSADSCDPALGCQHGPIAEAVTCDDGEACTGCSLPAGVWRVYAASAAAGCPEQAAAGCNALWMPGFFDGNAKHVVRFALDAGATLTWRADGTARLSGTVRPYHLGDGPGTLGQAWQLAAVFKYRGQGPVGQGSGGPKLDGGWVVPKGVSDGWDYFDMLSGSLTQVGGGAVVELTQKSQGATFPVQLGKGANSATWAYAASARVDWVKKDGQGTATGQGDVNLDLNLQPLPADCDLCAAGKCQAGAAKTCDDGNPCTEDACAAGVCSHKSVSGKPCDDGETCTPGDKCVQGACKPGDAKHDLCEDDNPCTKDLCNPGQGCLHAAAPKGTPCDDGDACTSGEACLGNKCKGGEAQSCADDNACTSDACDPKSGCSFAAVEGSCDDGNACTAGDHCAAGTCKGGAATTCDDSNVCTQDSCDPAKGCVYAPQSGTSCSDGNACTLEDTCIKGKCKTGNLDQCDDGKPCTQDSCDWQTGCLHLPMNGNTCEDGDKCTSGDLCAAGQCVPGGSVACDDDNPCTKDGCFSAIGCKFTALSGIVCDDGDKCKVGETCQGGSCSGGVAVDCNDANACTADVCDAALGCQHKLLDGKFCDDGKLCTEGETCKAGKCQNGAPTSCGDANPCTQDSCDPVLGCTHQAITGACDDLNTCTEGDSCQNGKCKPGVYKGCDDGNPCTLDGCDPKLGCTATDVVGTPCDDGDACTQKDLCVGGKCSGQAPVKCSDGNPCTIDSCDSAGGCLFKSGDGVKCDDGNACSVGDACLGGSCAPGKPANCDDGQVCTADSCQPATGCVHANADGKACDDGNGCTQGDACKGGKCQAGAGTSCDDGNPCTVDSCSAAKGCSHSAADGKGCDDGDACSLGDTCAGGACVGSDTLSCDDGNVCTSDFCNPKSGCYAPPNDGMACNDGDACTGDSLCKGGKCVGLQPLTCDDQQPCTVDSCDKQKGCVYTAQAGACSDGDACTSGDGCQGGKCLPGAKIDCSDDNPCTADGCDPKSGCSHQGLSGVSGSLTLVSDAQTSVGAAPAQPTWNGHPSWTASIPGATWIWSSAEVANPTADTTAVFTRSFSVPAGAANLTGTLVIAADNSYSCALNGKAVGADATEFNYFESSKDTWTLGGALQPGGNTLVCTVKNWGMWYGTTKTNPAGLLFKLSAAWSLPAGCDDGNACTSGDQCVQGQCKGGAAKVCDDGSACTQDSCDPKSGACSFSVSNGAGCSDGNACTGACAADGVQKQWQAAKADTDPSVGWAAGGHALHIPGFYDGNGGHTVRMTFDAAARFQITDGGTKGHLVGPATVFTTGGAGGGAVGDKWLVDVWFNYRGKGAAGQGSGGPKKELKDGVQPKTLTQTWLYFDMIPGQATLKRAGNPSDSATLLQAPAGSMYPFQIGIGANGKNLNFGASSWFSYARSAPTGKWSGQGDFNLDLYWIDPTGDCDTCKQGQCQGAPLSCDDLNPFTIDSCSPKGGCVHQKTNVCQD